MPLGSVVWCICSVSQVFNVEATGQYRKLFKLYAIPGVGGGDTGLEANQEKVDIREVRITKQLITRVREEVKGEAMLRRYNRGLTFIF